MGQLSDRLNRLAPSATLAMSQKSNEMKAQGIDVINMSVGEPDFNTPDHIKDADLVITSEVFSVDSLICSVFARHKTIIWHEMAKHNRMGGGMLSRFWYNVIPKLFMRKVLVVGRSEEARAFISRYCARVSETVIGHGVNLDVFRTAFHKTNTFCVVSQLIDRKRIDGIIAADCKR